MLAVSARQRTCCRASTSTRIIALLLAWAVLAGVPAALALPLADPAQSAERARFLSAERALAQGRLGDFRSLLTTLEDYPLYSYLRFDEMERRLASASDEEIAALLEDFSGSTREDGLRRRWLERTAARGDWQTLLAAWKPQSSAELRCQHARALYETGRASDAHAATRELWLVGSSQPDACDEPFRRWRAAGERSEDMVWQRLSLAARAGERRMVRYLARSLPVSAQPLAELWLEVRSQPRRVVENARFRPDDARRREIRLYGLRRLAPYEPAEAAAAWRLMENQHAWSEAERAAALRAIGLGFAQEHQPGGGEWLDAVADTLADDTVREWRVMTRLRERDWSGVESALARLPPRMADEETWRYWRARAASQRGDMRAAQALYESLAGERSFHGFLAADHLGRPYNLEPDILRFDAAELEATAALPGLARARELLALDRELDARREWYAALDGLDRDHLLRAARLAQLWSWHTQAIFTVARAGHFDDMEMRFPVLFAEQMNESAAVERLETAWLLAIARQESAFRTDARSPAGAMGLMQIMPATGRSIARALDETMRGPANLLDPSRSIRFGAHYLRGLLDRFDGQVALATAGYNAGPHRVERWRPMEGALEADLWVDTIPYAETRRYVQRVLYYTAIYEHQLGMTPTPLTERLPAVPARPPRTALNDG